MEERLQRAVEPTLFVGSCEHELSEARLYAAVPFKSSRQIALVDRPSPAFQSAVPASSRLAATSTEMVLAFESLGFGSRVGVVRLPVAPESLSLRSGVGMGSMQLAFESAGL